MKRGNASCGGKSSPLAENDNVGAGIPAESLPKQKVFLCAAEFASQTIDSPYTVTIYFVKRRLGLYEGKKQVMCTISLGDIKIL
ncbi:hypothetical protein KL86DPRO_20307 [uncultured delta proteobacterium]|uniref:Uncharacterized protein n=1 Tax=uncultured delta proteobacterium TaxID=34034 RepID=A0A212JY87_9DELT|nr:hypothetical protein KL86DPRO_20307 [uncultured delta proteobacterium]